MIADFLLHRSWEGLVQGIAIAPVAAFVCCLWLLAVRWGRR